jgi:hypothetical protein
MPPERRLELQERFRDLTPQQRRSLQDQRMQRLRDQRSRRAPSDRAPAPRGR